MNCIWEINIYIISCYILYIYKPLITMQEPYNLFCNIHTERSLLISAHEGILSLNKPIRYVQMADFHKICPELTNKKKQTNVKKVSSPKKIPGLFPTKQSPFPSVATLCKRMYVLISLWIYFYHENI